MKYAIMFKTDLKNTFGGPPVYYFATIGNDPEYGIMVYYSEKPKVFFNSILAARFYLSRVNKLDTKHSNGQWVIQEYSK